jgi:hypothetical protein
MNGRTTTLASVLVATAVLVEAAAAQPLFVEEFNFLDTAVWGEASQVPEYVGIPQTVGIETIDGDNALRLRSGLYDHERRGYGTNASFALTTGRLEVDFKVIDGIDGLIEAFLTEPTTGHFVGIGVYGGNWSLDRHLRAFSDLGGGIYHTGTYWSYGEWYRFVIDLQEDATVVSFCREDGFSLWTHSYDFAASDMGTAFSICLTQSMGIPGSLQYGDAAVGHVVFVPEPGAWVLIAFAAAVTGNRRRRGKQTGA